MTSLALDTPEARDIQTIPGTGIEGRIDGNDTKIVSVAWLDKQNIAYDKTQFNQLSTQGNSISFLIINNENVGFIAQGDQIKADAKQMITALNEQHIQPVMLTGDNLQAARQVAAQLGITDVHAQLLPEDKEHIIKSYQDKKHTVMMVGDGINDAPSLARADIGVAIGTGTDVAIDSADVILVRNDPADILSFLSLAKNTAKKMRQNLWWGAGYNIAAIPLAAGVLAFVGIVLSPAAGAILMSCSTVIVAINAMSLTMK